MNDTVSKYIEASKSNVYNIVDVLEDNIEFLENNLWSSKEEFNEIVKRVLNIYYDKYYLYPENDFSKIEKYIKFNNKINRKLKTILLSIIDYYEEVDKIKILSEKEGSILYLTILIYLSLVLYNTNFININNPKGIEKTINNVIDNFAKIRFKKTKDLVNIISSIKDIVEKNNEFRKYLDGLMTRQSHNAYINLSKGTKYYSVLYEYDIDELDDYDGKDIRIVINELDVFKKFILISFDLAYYTLFKLFELGYDYELLIPISREKIDDELIDTMFKDKNEKILKNIKFVVDYEEIEGDYEFINHMRSKKVNIFIQVNSNFESENYNMFLNSKDVIVEEEFITINDKYKEIWLDMEMNFVIKDMGNKISEKELLSGK